MRSDPAMAATSGKTTVLELVMNGHTNPLLELWTALLETANTLLLDTVELLLSTRASLDELTATDELEGKSSTPFHFTLNVTEESVSAIS